MKKISIFFVLILLMSFLLSGCAAPREKDSDELRIVTTIFPAYDFARQICGEDAEIAMLIPPGNEVHGYEPTLKDIALLEHCDLFIYAGGDSDAWMQDVVAASGNERLVTLSMMELVGMEQEEHDHRHGHEEQEEHDEHVWTSLSYSAEIVWGICDAVCMLDQANAETYRSNTKRYADELLALHEEYKDMAENAERDMLIFAERFPFRYLAEEYGFRYAAAFEGCSSETEPSLATIAELMETVRQEEALAVFYIEFSDGIVADTISRATGVKTLMLHSCQNVTKEDFEQGITYLELMQNNLKTLEEALNG